MCICVSLSLSISLSLCIYIYIHIVRSILCSRSTVFLSHVGMRVRMYECMYVCMYVCMHACRYACMHVCIYTSSNTRILLWISHICIITERGRLVFCLSCFISLFVLFLSSFFPRTALDCLYHESMGTSEIDKGAASSAGVSVLDSSSQELAWESDMRLQLVITYIYIYIYIYLSLSLYMCIYIYIYIGI